MMKLKKLLEKFMGISVLLLLFLSLSACGSKTSNLDKTTKASSKDKSGGSLIMTYKDVMQTAFSPQSVSTGDRLAWSPALESLGRKNKDGTYDPWLAESFKSDHNALTLTIKLKKNIKFSDGSDFNAEAVKWNFDKMVEAGKSSELGNPTAIEVVDNNTIKVSFKEWGNDWESLYGSIYIYSKQAYDDHGLDWCKIHPVGTGPYVLKELVQDNYILYKKNPNYRIKGHPYLDSIKIIWMSDVTSIISAMQNKEVDVVYTNDQSIISNLNGKFTNIANKTPDLAQLKYVMFNSVDKSSPFYNLKVRQAVMHAIDWKGVAKSLTGGFGDAVTQFGVPGSWSYDDNVKFLKYDVKTAKKLLSEAGYPDGFKTTITTISTNNDVATVLQAAVAKIGIDAEIKTVDAALFGEQKVNGGYDGGMITGSGASQIDFTNNYIRLYSSEGIAYHGMLNPPQDYEKALFGARAATSLAEKKKLLKKASKMLVHDYSLIFPVSATYTKCYTQDGLKDSGISSVSFESFTPENVYWSKSK